MKTNRRNWLKQTGIVAAGLGLIPFEGYSSPIKINSENKNDEIPVKLSSNENPYGPSASARIAMAEYINKSNRYNWELTSQLTSAIAKKNNVDPDNILLGAGSTEILDLVVRLAALNKGSFILAEPTYSYWSDVAIRSGLQKIAVPLTADKLHNLQAMLSAIRPDTKLIYLCNPNNPTGTICERDELVAFIKEATKNALVLVDEAYLDFTDQQSLCNISIENKNLIIAKTFSKIYGLAGGRIGYAIADTGTISKLSELQSWPNGSISVVSAAGALASLKDSDFVQETFSLNKKTREYTIEQLSRLKINCIPSHSNFIYFSLANYTKDFFEQLKNNNIIGTKIYEEQGKWSRITVGTKQEMEKLIHAIE